jgi:hypothetical protein
MDSSQIVQRSVAAGRCLLMADEALAAWLVMPMN